jgi:hypothetical protein
LFKEEEDKEQEEGERRREEQEPEPVIPAITAGQTDHRTQAALGLRT